MRSYRLKGPGYESCVYHCYVQLPSQLGIRFGWIPSWQLSLKYSNSATELPSDLVAQLKHISGHLPGCGRFESIPESLSFSHLFLFHLYFSPFFLSDFDLGWGLTVRFGACLISEPSCASHFTVAAPPFSVWADVGHYGGWGWIDQKAYCPCSQELVTSENAALVTLYVPNYRGHPVYWDNWCFNQPNPHLVPL